MFFSWIALFFPFTHEVVCCFFGVSSLTNFINHLLCDAFCHLLRSFDSQDFKFRGRGSHDESYLDFNLCIDVKRAIDELLPCDPGSMHRELFSCHQTRFGLFWYFTDNRVLTTFLGVAISLYILITSGLAYRDIKWCSTILCLAEFSLLYSQLTRTVRTEASCSLLFLCVGLARLVDLPIVSWQPDTWH